MSTRPLLRRAALVLGLMGVLMALADGIARRELSEAADNSFGRGGVIARTAAVTE